MASSAVELDHARACYAAEKWAEAFESFTSADSEELLHAADLELLARSAYMLGRDEEYVAALERAHDAHLATGEVAPAVAVTFWIGHSFLFRGQSALAFGWFGRGERLLAELGQECAEGAYLLIPRWLQQIGSGDFEAGYATALEAAVIAERYGDDDLVWLARDDQCSALLRQGRLDEGGRLLDELLVIAASGRLSPVVTGIVYCNTISFCHDVFELRRAAAWTDALTGWCERQPEMIAHNGLCLVHRAEVLQQRGAWTDALAEARRAVERFTDGVLNQIALGGAHYRQGEVLRLRGELAAAEDAYKQANRCGHDPQPGLALLRLAEGRVDAAAAAIRRAISERSRPLERVGLLPAYVRIMLATGELDRADAASRELAEIVAGHPTEALAAMAAEAAGLVALAQSEPEVALEQLRRSFHLWHALPAQHESAVVRVAIAEACAALGDDDAAMLEREAAREVFEGLGARLDLDRMSGAGAAAAGAGSHGLTDRELEVLRLVASGRTNREIAAVLVLSEHTVRRHLQNIFTKLGVTSRTAASAFAFEHDLVV